VLIACLLQVVDCYKAAEAGKVYRKPQPQEAADRQARGGGTDHVRVLARVQATHVRCCLDRNPPLPRVC
jgi:hypothetical protein